MKSIKFKPTAIDIPADDPFKNDLLSRKDSAEILTEFIGNLDEPFVLAIDSPWGTGKTTFLKMWLQYAMNQKIQCLYFNAWENDFSESPLVSLIGELGAGISALRLGEAHSKLVEKVFEKTKKAGAALIKTALPTAIKMATSGIVDLSDVANLAEEIAKKEIDKYQADKTTIAHFREELEELVKNIAGNKEQSQSRPIVFVIDELDRCRPPYAVELLEKVKHLFSVKGLVFVLAIDKRQLRESVKALYGTGMDADGYLRRFIDLEYHLPEPKIDDFVNAQFSRFGLAEILARKVRDALHELDNLRQSLIEFFKLFGFSLRVQEQIFSQLSVVVRTSPSNQYLYAFHLALLICLRTINKDLYSRYIQGLATPKEVMDFIENFPNGRKFSNSDIGRIVEAHLVRGIIDWNIRNQAIEFIDKQANATAGDETLIKRAKEVKNHIQWAGQSANDMTGFLVKKIELAQRFVKESEQ
jgi:KAP family P-loop domain